MKIGIAGLFSRLLISGAIGFLVSVASPGPLQADPIAITGGAIPLHSIESGIDWDNFSLTGPDSSFSGMVCCGFVSLPPSGGLTNLSGAADLGMPFHPATPQVVLGMAYLAIADGLMVFNTNAFVIPPPPSVGTAFEFSIPFTATGHIDGRAAETPDAPLFSVDIFGSGTATVSGTVTNRSGPSYDPLSVMYQFGASASPTPEPASLLLLGTGIVSVSLRCWRRRRSLNRLFGPGR